MNKKQITFVLVVLLALAVLPYAHGTAAGSSVGDFVTVDRVNDGDTITVIINRRKEKIRMAGMDAPEMGQAYWGRMAKDHLRDIIASSSWKVRLEYDVVRRDKYGRLLAYVWTKEGKMVNAEMLAHGYAVLFTFPPNVRHVDELRAAQEQARDRKLALWGDRGIKQAPADYRREHPREF